MDIGHAGQFGGINKREGAHFANMKEHRLYKRLSDVQLVELCEKMEQVGRVAHDVLRNLSYGEGERNAQFAMRVGAIMLDKDKYRELDDWVRRAIDLPMEGFCKEADVIFQNVSSRLSDLPMVVGLAWFKTTRDFPHYRTIVHRFRAWQLSNRVGIGALHIPQKVHRTIEIHSDFVPSAAALCVFHPLSEESVGRLRALSIGIFETLKPVIALTSVKHAERIERAERIVHERSDYLMRTSSSATVEAMVEVMPVLLNALVDQIEGVERGTLVHSIRQLGRKRSDIRLIISKHTANEQAELVAQTDDPCTLACACISHPTKANVALLPALFRRLSKPQMLHCARALNASDMLAVDDAQLLAIADAADLSELDSAWVSVLNATVTPRTTGRWLDVLGRALTADETTHVDKHGVEAAVVRNKQGKSSGKSPPMAQHRLLFLDDVCKLLDTDHEDHHQILHLTFYTAQKIPIAYAREVDTSGAIGSGTKATTGSSEVMTSKERDAYFAHKCYDELRMHNRHVKLPARSSKPADGLPIDVDTMSNLEVMLRHEANAMFKKYIDLDAIKDETIEQEAIDEAIELVQLEDLSLPSNDINPIDPESHRVLRKLALVKRQYMSKAKQRTWPYKTATGCRMRLVQWPRDSSKPLPALDPKVEALLL